MKQPIVIFSMIEWHSPLLHRNHMLAKYFAQKGHPVHFIEKKPLKSIKDLAANFSMKTSHVADNITVYQIPRIPYLKGYFPPAYFANDYFLIPYINKIAKKLTHPIIIIEFPMWIRLILNSAFRDAVLCYDISDEYELFESNPSLKQKMLLYEQLMIQKADYIFLTSENLLRKIDPSYNKVQGENVFILENGVDLELFMAAQHDNKQVLQDISKPIIGFIGGIFTWVDLKLIKQAAEYYPQYHFVLIGPTDQDKEMAGLQHIPNILYLGQKNKEEIAYYFKELDIGLIPYVSEENYTRLKTVNSNKVYQYMYYGYPVVSTYYSQAHSFSNLAYISYSKDDFIRSIQKAIEENDKVLRQKRQQFALSHSWENVVEKMVKILI